MNDLIKRIEETDDFSVVRAFEHLHDEIAPLIDLEKQEILDALPPQFRGVINAKELDLIETRAHEELSSTLSVKTAKLILTQFVESGFEGPVREALDDWKDDKQCVDAILELGIAASMIILAVAIEFEVKFKSATIRKGKLSTKQIKALSELVKSVLRKAEKES